MPIASELDALFIHVPKTGGTSVEKALGIFGDWRVEDRDTLFGAILSPDLRAHGFRSAYLQHLTYRDVAEIVDVDRLRTLFSFAFVRNPWDRVVSSYANPDPHMVEQARGAGIALKGVSFDRFVDGIGELDHSHLMCQAEYVFGADGRQAVDFIGRFERLAADFAQVCTRLEIDLTLPHENAARRRDYRAYYDARTRQRVADMYRDDIQAFGYRF